MITARKRQTSLFLIVMLHLTAAATWQYLSVRVGDEVTLPCANVAVTKNYCKSITWILIKNKTSTTLFENRQLHKNAAAKSNILTLTADCSLVIKNVSVEDAGRYVYRHYIDLSVIHMVQQNQKDKIILNCSVTEYKHCRHTVEWLNEAREEMFSDMEKSDQSCSAATVMFPTSVRNWRPNLKCKVTNIFTKNVQLFAFSLHSSGGRKGKDSTCTMKSTTKETTTTPPHRTISLRMSTTKSTKPPTTISETTTTTTGSSSKWTSIGINPSTSVNHLSKIPGRSWLYIIGSAGIIIPVLMIIGWKKTKGNKTKKESERNTDPEDNVSYATIKIKRAKKTKKKPRVPDPVTYSTVNTSAQATIDPDSIYCKI